MGWMLEGGKQLLASGGTPSSRQGLEGRVGFGRGKEPERRGLGEIVV